MDNYDQFPDSGFIACRLLSDSSFPDNLYFEHRGWSTILAHPLPGGVGVGKILHVNTLTSLVGQQCENMPNGAKVLAVLCNMSY